MAESKSMETTTRSIGDSAVDGLFGGAIAGILMAVYLVIAMSSFRSRSLV